MGGGGQWWPTDDRGLAVGRENLGARGELGLWEILGGSCVSKRIHRIHRQNPQESGLLQLTQAIWKVPRPTWYSWGSGPGRKVAGPRQ